jgi:uncharacterized membrane protein YgcG
MSKTKFLVSVVAMALGSAALGASTQPVDDNSRFSGNWMATFLYYNTPVTIVSIHDTKSYKNYVILPQGAAPAGSGAFAAAGGTWTSDNTPAPFNTGSYNFIDNNSVLCTNAVGQSCLWQRDNLPLPPIVGTAATAVAGSVALPDGTNLTSVKPADAIGASRALAAGWHADAILIWAQVVSPSPDGTVNILAHPQAFNFLFYSPSTTSSISIVSTAPTGNLIIAAPATPRPMPTIAIKPAAIDLTQAFANEKLFGFNGNASQATLSFAVVGKKPMRLVWEIQTGEAYPRIVSGSTGAILSPFEVLDDKVADYNQLAALHRVGNRSGGNGFASRTETGINIWEPDPNPSATNANGEQPTEEDTWDRDVRLQNAFNNNDPEAYNRTLNNENTDADLENYGGGGEGGGGGGGEMIGGGDAGGGGEVIGGGGEGGE